MLCNVQYVMDLVVLRIQMFICIIARSIVYVIQSVIYVRHASVYIYAIHPRICVYEISFYFLHLLLMT